MQNPTSQLAQLQQVQNWFDDLVSWIITAPHTKPSRIINLPEGVHTLSDAEMQRMTDEYNMIESVIRILDEAKTQLAGMGITPMTYEEQIAQRFDTLMHPNSMQLVNLAHQSASTGVFNNGVPVPLKVNAAYTVWRMFQQIEIVRNSYTHLMYPQQTETRQ
jgi:hypothetical protein